MRIVFGLVSAFVCGGALIIFCVITSLLPFSDQVAESLEKENL